jgi:CspA family cold shock protein
LKAEYGASIVEVRRENSGQGKGCLKFRQREGRRGKTAPQFNSAVRPVDRCGPSVARKGDAPMPQGTVKWFNPTKGYGFIAPDTGGKDIFVHISAVQKAGLRTLNEGQQIGFEVEQQQNGRLAAVNLAQST